MSKFKKHYDNFITIFTSIVWSTKKLDDVLGNQLKRIRFVRLGYVGLVIFASLISVFSLVSPTEEIKPYWGPAVATLQLITFAFFIFDYVAHLVTYRIYNNLNKDIQLWKSTVKFIFSGTGIVILLCILTSLHVIEDFSNHISPALSKAINFFRILNIFRFIRLFIVLAFFAPFKIIIDVFAKQKKVLSYVLLLVILVIIVFAILIWNNETVYLENEQKNWLESQKIDFKQWQEFLNYKNLNEIETKKFLQQHPNLQTNLANFENNYQSYQDLSSGYVKNFVDALYFSTITLTTIGYGDLLPHAPITKIIVSVNALIALAIIAIPSGVIAGAFLTEMQAHIQKKNKKKDTEVIDETNQNASENEVSND
ncbi:potassium channel family protein [Mycoplasma sp. 394]